MLASEEITKSFTPGVHFNTFGGSPFVCYLMWRYYRWLAEHLETVRETGEGIRFEFGQREWIKEHDGAGLLNAFTPDFELFGYDGFQFIHKAREFGLSLVTHRQFGPIRFTPPMNVTHGTVKLAFEALDKTHTALTAG
jgi:acetylornithine/succinyldiaminopimelate/putrescine aminotransferase